MNDTHAQDSPPERPDTDDGVEQTLVFFDRVPPEGYLDEWSARLARPPEVEEPDQRSLLVFRLEGEWLALETGIMVEVTDLHPIHTIPHRTSEVLLGLVNIRGQLRICVSLHALLGVDRGEAGSGDPATRMLIVQDQLDQWVFAVQEVGGVARVRRGQLRKVPTTFGQSAGQCQAVFDWDGRTVGYLDSANLLNSLRSLCS